MTSTIRIDEGLTYEYLTHGFFIAIAGIPISFIHPIFILIILVGLAMAMSKTGIEIDETKLKVRKYVSWVFFKTGKWYDLREMVTIELKLNTQYSSIKTTREFNSERADSSTKTYDLIATTNTSKQVLINEFTNARLAFKAFDILEELSSDYEAINHIIDVIQSQRQKRKTRR